MAKQSKNLAKVQSMLDGTYGGKIQSGYTPTEKHREVGDKWTDSEGYEWEQKEGFRVKSGGNMISSLSVGVNFTTFSKV